VISTEHLSKIDQITAMEQLCDLYNLNNRKPVIVITGKDSKDPKISAADLKEKAKTISNSPEIYLMTNYQINDPLSKPERSEETDEIVLSILESLYVMAENYHKMNVLKKI